MTETKRSRRAALQDLHLPLPDQSTHAVNNVHAGLWLDKYIPRLGQYKASSQDGNGEGPQQTLVDEVASLSVPKIYGTFYQRWKQTLDNAGASKREFTVKNRLVVGLGNEGVLETSVTLHRTYGVPYIPGSALKGLAASYARLLAGEEWQSGKEAYQTVFGDTENAGFLTFFDALYIPRDTQQLQASTPAEDRPLRADIITVHHPAYYQGKRDKQNQPVPPADWDSPNPVPFLSATGCYLIALAAPDLTNQIWIEKTFDLLEEALLVLGIGAKTASGYGRMERAGTQKQVNTIATIPTPALSLPAFQEGHSVKGIVVKPDQRVLLQKRIANSENSQFLIYSDERSRVYPLEQIVIVVAGQDLHWNAGDQRNCRVLQTEKLNDQLLVICEPVISKMAEKKKKR